MARLPSRARAAAGFAAEMREAETYYRELLSGPAVRPWDGGRWDPITIGPSWRVKPDGTWDLPRLTLGWEFLAWTSVHFRIDGEPIRWTGEQARFWLWWFAVDDDGVWLYTDATFQRLKGHGKDPMAAALAGFELVGPCRVDYIDGFGKVHGKQHSSPWVDVAAVTQAQTKTTMRLLPSMIPTITRRMFGIREPGKITVYARQDQAFLQAVTSNAAALEGNRSTLVIIQEPHHWQENNSGHDMNSVLKRNIRKSKGGSARMIRFTNAYQAGLDSVAEQDREAHETGKTSRYLYDTLEAPRDATLAPEIAAEIVEIVKGDSYWLNSREILNAIEEVESGRATEAEVRRFWYNQVEGAADAWIDPRAWDENRDDGLLLNPKDRIVIFFDGSKSIDATALVACRIDDGAVFLLGLWQRPPGHRGKNWRVSRDAVDWIMAKAMQTYEVWGVWGDPSDAEDDEGGSYWRPVLDAWHDRWGDYFVLSASREATGHSVIWDMRSPKHQREFVEAAEQFVDDVERGQVPHAGDKRLTRHIRNAKKRPGKYGVGLGKSTRTSRKKVDGAVCAVGARMMRREALVLHKTKKRRGGRTVGAG